MEKSKGLGWTLTRSPGAVVTNGTGGAVLGTFAALDESQPGWSTFPTSIALAGHCMSQIDSMTLVLTGGYLSTGTGPYRQRTYFFSWFSQQLTTGPNLITSRAEHGCSFITGMDGNPTAIVAGGQVS